MKGQIITLVFFITSLVAVASAGVNMDLYEKIYQKNRVESLMNRWWYFYETPNKNLANQLDLFTEDFTVISINGAANRSNYAERIAQLPANDLNAHHLEQLDIVEVTKDTIKARAVILYQRLREGELFSAKLSYDLLLENTKDILPKIKHMHIQLLNPVGRLDFVDRYNENRFGSLAKYFGALFDRPGMYPKKFDEIFDGEKFKWTHTNGDVMNLEQFKTHFSALSSRVKDSSHIMHNLEVMKIAGNKYAVSFNFQWRGTSVSGEKMQAMSRHEWIVRDTNGRYPVIESVEIKSVEPMAKI